MKVKIPSIYDIDIGFAFLPHRCESCKSFIWFKKIKKVFHAGWQDSYDYYCSECLEK